MAHSIREQILLAVIKALGPPTAGSGATLHRSPTAAISREQSPALLVVPESEAIVERANDRVTRELTVRITALSRALPPVSSHAEADQLLTAAHAALMADTNLGGLALGLREVECEWEVDDADASATAIPARYRITYRTMAADLSLPG